MIAATRVGLNRWMAQADGGSLPILPECCSLTCDLSGDGLADSWWLMVDAVKGDGTGHDRNPADPVPPSS